MTYKSYRKDYSPTDDVKSYEHCNSCGKSWYAASNRIGFLVCPYCNKYTSISTRLDTTGGNMKLQTFDGTKYSTRPSNIQQAPRQRAVRRGLKELNRVLSFTGVQKQ